MKEDKAANPIDVRLLGTDGVMFYPKCQRKRSSNLGEEATAALEGDTPKIVSK
jgi:hypothetical protein